MNVETPKRKTGPRPKKTVVAQYTGIEVGRGENKKVIDPKEVERLAAMGCKNSEIAQWLDIDDSTLRYNFKQHLIKGRGNLKQSLRMAQLKYALDGSVPLLIWLGKQVLGQSDIPIDEDVTPEMTPEDIDNRIQELLKTLKDDTKQSPGTNDAAATQGAADQVQPD